MVGVFVKPGNWIESVQLWLILGILFFIPISPAAPNILGVLLIAAWFVEGRFGEKWLFLSRHPLFWAMMSYLAIYPISLLWSDNLEWGAHIVERHAIYLLFPFLLTSLKSTYIKYYFLAFVLGVSVTELTSYAVWFDLIRLEGVSAENPAPFFHHTQYNPILAWALYLLMSALFFEKHPVWLKSIAAIFVFTMSANMFITAGRGGQVTYFVIATLVVWQFFSRHKMQYRGLLVAFSFVGLVAFTAYQFSPLFQERADLAVEQVVEFEESECAGSVGARLCMYLNTAKMSYKNPLLGSGVGDFPEDYTNFVGPEATFKMIAAKEVGHSHPHNQYLYELGALGLLGLGILLWIFVVQIRLALKWHDFYRPHRIAFTIYIAVALLSDSLLLAHSTGLVFICFGALLFFRPIEESPGGFES